jgi:UDP-GlcNAc3NAcA epimerase
MRVVTIVGARPQFIKASAISRELRRHHQEVLVHTGQHYDYAMSGVFFNQLEIPTPDVNLGVGSSPHGSQTGAMLERIEQVLIREKPRWVLVYGDTNSTLAGALAAAKLHLPVAHVEAGLRSFNRRMPEEINRVIADHLSDLLLCPSATAMKNLYAEGLSRPAHLVGDVMLDVLNWAQRQPQNGQPGLKQLMGMTDGRYLLATIHRSENTDDPERLMGIVDALNAVEEPVIFPAHPRVIKMLAAHGLKLAHNVHVVPPLDYFEMVHLTGSARLVLTDSGGLQKEAYWLGTPCITLRDETEWTETVTAGWNRLTGANTARIIDAVRTFAPPATRPALYGDGNVAALCVELLA